jgi:hypothetical protein
MTASAPGTLASAARRQTGRLPNEPSALFFQPRHLLVERGGLTLKRFHERKRIDHSLCPEEKIVR